MAGGGDLPSLKDGSDSDFELTCTPCSEDNVREEAIKYCQECEEYLCAMCTKHHGRLKATRAHILLDKDNAKQSPFVAKTKCCYHPDRDIEMYCEAHDMVYCTMCIATEHRSCDDVNKIEDKLESSVNQTEIHRVLDETKNALETIKAVVVKQKKNIVSLEEQRNVIQNKLEDVKTSLIEHILKLKKETSDSVDKVYAKTKEELAFGIKVSANMVQNLEKTLEQMQLVDNLDAGQQFIHLKLMNKTIKDANRLHANSESNVTSSLHFTENKDLLISVMTATALGKVCTEAEDRKTSKPVQYKMKSKKEINMRMANDMKICSISDVCLLSDGMIVLTDQGNNKVKRLDLNYNMKDHCDLDAYPTGICCINKNEIAVKMDNNNIQLIFVASSLIKTRRISIEYGKYWGMAYYDGGLWSSKNGGVNVYSTTGGLIKSIDKDRNGKAIFKTRTVQHMAVCCDTMIITDYSDGAVCVNMDGTVERELRDSRLGNTRGVCVSVDGTVFLSGHCSNNIVMFSCDGKYLGELAAGLNKPISMCYDKNKKCVIVTCRTSNNIHIIELSE